MNYMTKFREAVHQGRDLAFEFVENTEEGEYTQKELMSLLITRNPFKEFSIGVDDTDASGGGDADDDFYQAGVIKMASFYDTFSYLIEKPVLVHNQKLDQELNIVDNMCKEFDIDIPAKHRRLFTSRKNRLKDLAGKIKLNKPKFHVYVMTYEEGVDLTKLDRKDVKDECICDEE